MKSSAPSTVGTCPQLPAMRLDNGTADGQPHAAALRFGGEEGRKDLIHLHRVVEPLRLSENKSRREFNLARGTYG